MYLHIIYNTLKEGELSVLLVYIQEYMVKNRRQAKK